ncbi:MAG: hypothetical protein RBU29_10225, partial [bacterium]|nr:hypothetical protein [bacterium]
AFFSLIPASLTFRVIALNQPDPLNGLTNRVYTREFFSQARAHLAEKGVLVFSITGTPNYEQGDLGFYGATLYWTLRDIFPHVLVLPGTTWWFFASPSPLLTSDPAELTTRYQEAQVQSSLFRPEFYSLYYEPPRIEALHSLLEQNSQAVRNTDTAPVCYFYTFCLWLKQYGYLPGLSLQQLAQGGSLRIFLLGGTMVLMGTLPLIVVRLLSPRSARPQAYPTTILVFNGLTGMSVELCVLLFYQTQTGCLYEHISIFFGVFMAGLALGAQQALSWIANRALPLPRLLWVVDLGFTVLLLVTPLLLYFCRPAFFSVPVIELVLLFWIGVLAYGMGLVFPAASGCIAQHTPQTPAIAGWAGMSDNLGGAVGAFGTGIVLIPLLGLPATIWCLAGFKLLLVGWGWWRIRETS